MNKLRLYEVNQKYLSYLHAIDNRVSLEHKQANKRKFIGIVLEINDIKYFAPLSSPKEKHKRLKENIDIYKIKNGELGVVNFNNMIPVNDRLFTMVDLSKIKQVSYRYLMLEQLRIFNNDYEKITKKAKKIYSLRYKSYFNTSIKDRCCDWAKLEIALRNYEVK